MLVSEGVFHQFPKVFPVRAGYYRLLVGFGERNGIAVAALALIVDQAVREFQQGAIQRHPARHLDAGDLVIVFEVEKVNGVVAVMLFIGYASIPVSILLGYGREALN